MSVSVQKEHFDIAEELRRFHRGDVDIGAVASFIGYVRAKNDGEAVSALTLEHYPGMAEKAIEAIISSAKSRWEIRDARVVHRVGHLRVGEQIVLVLTASAHRSDAFAACEFIMDYLKTEAPFWKEEHTSLGRRWVLARESDFLAQGQWKRAD